MSRRSDVSKMLVSHHGGRAGSSVGSAAGSRRIARDNGSTVSTAKMNVAAVKRPTPASSPTAPVAPTTASSSSTVAPSTTTPVNKNSNYGFLQMKCLEVLKERRTPLHIQELQVRVGSDYKVVGDRDFLRILAANPRVHYDTREKLWSFVSPYKWLDGSESILTYLRSNRQFDINNEVLEYNKEAVNWINELLTRHAVRAIRGTKTARCKVFSSESGLYCDLYHPDERCDGCKGLQGIILYPLGSDYLENVEMDPDVKELWHKILPTPSGAVAALMGSNKRPAGASGQQQGRTKRRKPAGARAPRIHRISNIHIYTAEELKEVLASETPNEPC